MSEHTPLTEAERIERVLQIELNRCWTCHKPRVSEDDWDRYAQPGEGEHLCWEVTSYTCTYPCDVPLETHIAERILAARTSTATADTADEAAVEALMRSWGVADDDEDAYDSACRDVATVRAALATADTGLREALAGITTHNGAPLSPKNLRWAATHEALCRSFIFDVLTGLADLLDATPASTEDRADNEGTP